MTKADIVENIAERTGLTKTDTALVVEGMIETLKEAMISGETVEIRGFGTFKIKERAARRARNPRTGEPVDIPTKFVPTFKPSRDLKNAVADWERQLQ
ncbi:MAG: integration host factor subunit beta [Candidatus Latescibacteria bacterium]|jgi:nucleoid DNA-binding protein|nr:integration host factor subunit beta [Candidatus Latescibacterota bacterium]